MLHAHPCARCGVLVLVLIAALTASTARAGVLNGHAAAFGGATGSLSFDNGVGLSGTIDYAVFTADAFNANFAGLGYVPGDSLVYAYQLFPTGSLGVSAEIIGISNPANTIGAFDIGDANASSASFTPNARWLFTPELAPGQSSWGLAFSSPNLPTIGAALTIDGGTQSLISGIPTPGSTPLPEPASLALLALGGGLLTRRTRRRASAANL